MKTWEVIKSLMEDKRKRFALPEWDDDYIKIDDNGDGYIVDKDGEYYDFPNGIYHDDWEEVIQSVTWQEALIKLVSGCSIKCVFDGEEYIYTGGFMSKPIFVPMLQRGKWYIL